MLLTQLNISHWYLVDYDLPKNLRMESKLPGKKLNWNGIELAKIFGIDIEFNDLNEKQMKDPDK